MSEEARPFEEYKEMIKDMRKEEMIKGLYDLSKNINEKSKEIKRLNNIINDMDKQIDNLCNNQKREVERLNNIINEIEDSIVGKINVLYQFKGQSNAIQELNILLNYIRELKESNK